MKPEVAIALVALSVSPLPPLLPSRGEKAGGEPEYGLAGACFQTPYQRIATDFVMVNINTGL